MNLLAIGLMTLAAFSSRLFRSERPTALLLISVIAIFALQPTEPMLPTLTLMLLIGVWWIVTPAPTRGDYRLMLIFAGAACIAFGLLAARLMLAVGAVAVSAVGVGLTFPTADSDESTALRRRLAALLVAVIVALLLIIKLPALQDAVTGLVSQVMRLPIASGWQWLGFSYIAFRLMHVLLDFRSGRLRSAGTSGASSLRDFALYVIFFPALPSGPIDRIEHFSRELAQPDTSDQTESANRIANGAYRLGVGLFKKFVLADSLAVIALSPDLVAQINRGLPWSMWIMLYAYTFRIFFDFSGYSDIAIGIGLLAGIQLPENFTAPYLQRNIAAFWNSWHITLSTWFRNYFFTPLSRAMVQRRLNRWLIIFIAQISTMILIGLWHGVALNFILWGAWHGLGLWAHRWLVDHSRGWDEYVQARPRLARSVHVLSILATFHFVAIGWIFFALPDLALIGKALAALVGARL